MKRFPSAIRSATKHPNATKAMNPVKGRVMSRRHAKSAAARPRSGAAMRITSKIAACRLLAPLRTQCTALPECR